MAKPNYRGDAVPVAQITRVTPANVVIGDVFKIFCNGKSVSYTATAATVENVVNGLAAAIAATSIPEFSEFLASGVDSTGDGHNDYLALTAAIAGVPFVVTATASSSTYGSVIVTESTSGHAGVNEVHEITLAAAYTGGTFTLSWDFGSGTETTSAIAYNANAATVQAAIVALATPGSGDVLVTGGPGPSSPWFVQFQGALANTASSSTRRSRGQGNPTAFNPTTSTSGKTSAGRTRSRWTARRPRP
jgi:hypothetical protein